MSKQRVVIVGVLAVVAAVIAYFALGRGGDTTGAVKTSSGSGSSAGKVTVGRGEKDPSTGLPRWFGASGIGAKRIGGVVLGEDGKPVPGATVRLASALADAGIPGVTKQSDANGLFDFGLYPAAIYVVTAEMPRLTAAFARIDLRDPLLTPASDRLQLVLHACKASIHGTVFDSAGGAIAGARIVRTEWAVRSGAGVETDGSGSYELCVPAGGAGVNISADGYGAIDDNVYVYGRTRRDFQLTPGASVIGRVVRATDRSPVAQAVVMLRVADPRKRDAMVMGATGADGTFAFDAVGPGRWMLTAFAEELSTKESVDVIAELGGAPAEVTVELVGTYKVAGKVVERGSGKPVAGRAVMLMSSLRDNPAVTRPLSSQSQADGTFVIDRVVPGTYVPTIGRGEDRRGDPVTVVDQDIGGVVLETTMTGSIAGRVLYDGKPVDGALVRDDRGSSSTTSNSDGTYLLRNVGDGTHKLYSESHLVGAFTNSPPVTLAAGENKTGVDIVLDLSASVSGVVVDQNDAPVAGAFVSFSLLRGRDFGSATTADDGSFTARSMSGGGEYVYEVKPRDQSPLVLPPVVGKRHPPVAVKDGATHVTGLRVKVKYERLAISGRVVDGAGKPVADAVVSAEGNEGGWYRSPSATSDQSGAFSIRDLPAGKYTVKATTARGEAREERIDAGTSNLELAILDAGGIDGTLVGFTAVPEVVALRTDDYFGRYRPSPGTTTTAFQMRNVPAGRYQITASGAGRTASASVQVLPGQIAKVTVQLGEVGTVVGRVVDATGAPVADMRCTVVPRDNERMGYGGERNEAITDASGSFRVERANAGPSYVGCFHPAARSRSYQALDVAPNAVTNVELKLEASGERSRNGHAGLELEDQLENVLVESVEANGPAARAGLAVGDALVTVDGVTIGRYQSEYAMRLIESPRGDAKQVTIVVERAGKEITATLTLDPPK